MGSIWACIRGELIIRRMFVYLFIHFFFVGGGGGEGLIFGYLWLFRTVVFFTYDFLFYTTSSWVHIPALDHN